MTKTNELLHVSFETASSYLIKHKQKIFLHKYSSLNFYVYQTVIKIF